jgi:uncharacterized protein
VAGASALTLERPGDPATFKSIAGPFLAANEAENNVAIGITDALIAGRDYGPTYFGVVREGERVVGVAMRAGLYLIVATGTRDDTLPLIVDDAIRATPDAPGIVGAKDLAKRAVALWTERTGQRAHVQMAERIYRLSRVIPPRPVSGRMRAATFADLDRVSSWFHAFVVESQPWFDDSPEAARVNAERWIRSGLFRVWDDDGVVSMAGSSGQTQHGIRVGAVYTPPEKRRRGYASALVAALSQEQLDAGRRFCFLYTDLANPTSNKIYLDIGYQPVIDVDQYAFEGPAKA